MSAVTSFKDALILYVNDKRQNSNDKISRLQVAIASEHIFIHFRSWKILFPRYTFIIYACTLFCVMANNKIERRCKEF